MIKLSLKLRLLLLGVLLVGAAMVYAMEFSGWHNLEAVTLDADSVTNWRESTELQPERSILKQPVKQMAQRLLADKATARVDIEYELPNAIRIERNHFTPVCFLVDVRSQKMYGLNKVGLVVPLGSTDFSWEHPVITGTRINGLFELCDDFRVCLILSELSDLRDENTDLYRLIDEIDISNDETTVVRISGLSFALKTRADALCDQLTAFIRFVEDYHPDLNGAAEFDLRFDNLIVQKGEGE